MRKRVRWITPLLAAAGLSVLAAPGVAPVQAAHRHSRAHRTRRANRLVVPGSTEYGCPILPAEDPLNQEVAGLPESPSSPAVHRKHRRERPPAPRLRQQPQLRDPLRGRRTRTGARSRSSSPKYESESDPGPYPIPPDAPIEGGGKKGRGDKHVLVMQEGSCMLYELYKAMRKGEGLESSLRGDVFNLRSDALRPEGWTSADAAGLPIFPLLVRYPEVSAGAHRPRAARHRVRRPRTATSTRRPTSPPAARTPPAADGAAPAPEGELQPRRLQRRGADHPAKRSKRYGLIVADNGSPWYITGAPTAALERRRPRTDQAGTRDRPSKRSKRVRSSTSRPGRGSGSAPVARDAIESAQRPGAAGARSETGGASCRRSGGQAAQAWCVGSTGAWTGCGASPGPGSPAAGCAGCGCWAVWVSVGLLGLAADESLNSRMPAAERAADLRAGAWRRTPAAGSLPGRRCEVGCQVPSCSV